MEFTALIANLGKYAAGIVAETPLAFPTTTEQVQKALQTIGVDGLKYEEVIEGFAERNQNLVKISPNKLEVTKKGLTNIHMVFEENKKNLTCYSTPYGNLMIGIEGGPVSIQETDDRIEVRANYSLDINYEHVANCEIRMHIQSKEAQQFSLTEM